MKCLEFRIEYSSWWWFGSAEQSGDGRGEQTNLAGGIDNLSRKVFSFVANLLAERVLDSRVVTLDEMTVYEAHRQGGLACGREVSVLVLGEQTVIPRSSTYQRRAIRQ